MWTWAILVSQAWAGDNLFGGRIVTHNQLYVSAGFPTAEVGVHVPIGASFEITPWGRFRWGEGVGVGPIGAGAGLDLRVPVLKGKKFQGALWFSAGGEVQFPSDAPWGDVQLGQPGWMMTWAATDELDLDFGVRVEADLLIHNDDLDVRVTVPALVGVGFQVADGVQIGVRTSFGPAFLRETVVPDVSALFFVGWSL